MGDHTSCSLVVFGKTTEAQFEALVNLIDAEEPEKPNWWVFHEVNYAQFDPEIEQAVRDAGLSYIWSYDSGGGYPAGVELYNALTKAWAEYRQLDMDIMIDVRNTDIESARQWQRFLDEGLEARVEFT